MYRNEYAHVVCWCQNNKQLIHTSVPPSLVGQPDFQGEIYSHSQCSALVCWGKRDSWFLSFLSSKEIRKWACWRETFSSWWLSGRYDGHVQSTCENPNFICKHSNLMCRMLMSLVVKIRMMSYRLAVQKMHHWCLEAVSIIRSFYIHSKKGFWYCLQGKGKICECNVSSQHPIQKKDTCSFITWAVMKL